jgi:glycosyltransferase involved in cell wall biosynthesis
MATYSELPELVRWHMRRNRIIGPVGVLGARALDALAQRLASETIVFGAEPAAATYHLGLAAPRYSGGAAARIEGRVVIVYHGRVSPEKEIPLLVDAIRQVRDRTGTRVVLRVVGDGSTLGAVFEAARAGEVEVDHVPWTDSPLEWVAGADIFVNPSRTEVFSMSTLEALGCGLPVVVRDVGYLPTFVEHDTNGLLFHADAELVGCIERLVCSADLRSRLGAAARQRAVDRTVWEQLASQFAEICTSPQASPP